jgi:hypothetical protein
MNMSTLKPFGYTFHPDSSVDIKLRFKLQPFMDSKLVRVGKHRTTNNGYVIFEISTHTADRQYAELREEFKRITTSK